MLSVIDAQIAIKMNSTFNQCYLQYNEGHYMVSEVKDLTRQTKHSSQDSLIKADSKY